MISLSEYLKKNNDVLDTSLDYVFRKQSDSPVRLTKIVFKDFKHKDLDGYEKYRNSYVITDGNVKIPTTMILIK